MIPSLQMLLNNNSSNKERKEQVRMQTLLLRFSCDDAFLFFPSSLVFE